MVEVENIKISVKLSQCRRCVCGGVQEAVKTGSANSYFDLEVLKNKAVLPFDAYLIILHSFCLVIMKWGFFSKTVYMTQAMSN